MPKISMGPQILFYPAPALLIGANVAGKPNFTTISWGGVACSKPPMVSIAIRPQRYNFDGMRQNGTFSVNIPSSDLVKETDYCGITSGSRVDKVEVCRFKVFYGKLETAPMIEQCPVNLECKVMHILNLRSHSLFIGQIEETYVSDTCLTDGKPDVQKIKPMVYGVGWHQYLAFGPVIAQAMSIGKELRAEHRRSSRARATELPGDEA